MEETLAKLAGYQYESGGELVVWLRKQADNLDYDAIREQPHRMPVFFKNNFVRGKEKRVSMDFSLLF